MEQPLKKPLKVLIVEDEFLIAMSLELQLSRLGYIVCETVATGEAAVQAVGNERPDVALMDVHLAGHMSGIQAGREINSRFHTPLVFLTGYMDRETLDTIQALKPLGCFSKPVYIYQIHQAIVEHFESKD